MNYNVTPCELCKAPLNFRELRKAVYWLPDMDSVELQWARYEGFVFNFAHRACWMALKPKRQDLIRVLSFEGAEPRSRGELV